MTDPEDTNRIRKVEARKKAQEFEPANRGYLHSMTNSRVKRNKELVHKVEGRKKSQGKSSAPSKAT